MESTGEEELKESWGQRNYAKASPRTRSVHRQGEIEFDIGNIENA